MFAVRFQILKYPSRLWYRSYIYLVMKSFIDIHNMVVKSRLSGYESEMFELIFCEDARNFVNSKNTFKWDSRVTISVRSRNIISDGM